MGAEAIHQRTEDSTGSVVGPVVLLGAPGAGKGHYFLEDQVP